MENDMYAELSEIRRTPQGINCGVVRIIAEDCLRGAMGGLVLVDDCLVYQNSEESDAQFQERLGKIKSEANNIIQYFDQYLMELKSRATSFPFQEPK